MKTTIEDLKVNKTLYRSSKDIFGNRTREPYERAVKRKIKLVTGWQRFGHYLLDYVIITAIIYAVDYFILRHYYLDIAIETQINGFRYNFLPNARFIVVTVAYYFICEFTMQRTLGKIATRSVVINEYAQSPKAGPLIGRSFARLVPFETFSCLGDRGWHDRWSKTYVVTKKERTELRRLLNEQEGIFFSESEEVLD